MMSTDRLVSQGGGKGNGYSTVLDMGRVPAEKPTNPLRTALAAGAGGFALAFVVLVALLGTEPVSVSGLRVMTATSTGILTRSPGTTRSTAARAFVPPAVHSRPSSGQLGPQPVAPTTNSANARQVAASAISETEVSESVVLDDAVVQGNPAWLSIMACASFVGLAIGGAVYSYMQKKAVYFTRYSMMAVAGARPHGHGLVLPKREEPMTDDELGVNSIRMLAVDGVNKANSGHPGAPMGQAPMAYVLWNEAMKYNPKNPYWVNRDRFVLSSGHGCMLQYSMLHLTGYDDVTLEDLKKFRQWGSKTPGHPENFETKGVEVTTGPLGMGLSNAVGLALAERHLAGVYNKTDHEIINHYTYTIAGDGCFQEGITHESCSYAGHMKLGKLIALYDDNNITIDGETSLSFTEDVAMRYEAYGWQVIKVLEGDTDLPGIRQAIKDAKAEKDKPTLIMVKTVIGYGSPNKANSHDAHGAPLGADEAKATRDNLGWEFGEFEIPEKTLAMFREAIPRGEKLEEDWNKKLEAYKKEFPELGKQFQDVVIDGKLTEGWADELPSYTADDAGLATRIHSQKCINALAPILPGFLGGSADLAPSNMTLMKSSGDCLPGQYENKNLRFGVREFGMGAVANALALHKTGLIPYCATFLIFSDYMRNAIRLSALSQAGTIFVMTHDSVALGEDGPTHQPIETIGSLRMIPQLAVMRPCDGNETSGAYKIAVMRSNGTGKNGINGKPMTLPTLMCLSRQVLPNQAGSSIDAVAKGAYAIHDCEGTPDVILIGTGSEVQLCIDAAKAMEGKKVRVVSMPCMELYDDQSDDYKAELLPKDVPTVSVEAGSTFGWSKYAHASVGIDTFGASAPGGVCMEKFGMTVDNVVATAKTLMK